MRLEESQCIELKESWRDEYLKTIAAFANTDGGKLLIGYNDSGIVTGVDKSKKLLEDLPNKIASMLGIIASVTLREDEGKQVIAISVSKCSHPVSYQSRFYTRSGSTTQEVRGSELQQLILKANNMTWDEVSVPQATFDDIDETAVRLFVSHSVEHNRLPSDMEIGDVKRLFHNLELTDTAGQLTRAAILLFGKKPTRFVRSSTFKIGRFRGEDYTDLIIQDMVEGNLFQMPDRVMDLLKSKYLLSPISYRGLQRIETLEIPEKAMREAILNSIIHRDYSSSSSIELRVFDTTVILWNHGAIEAPLTIETLKEAHGSYPRNSLIAKIFYRAGYIEAFGRGIMTIVNETVKEGLSEPVFKDFSQGLQVIFTRRQVKETTKVQAETKSLNKRQRKAIEYVNVHGSISNSEYQKINKVSRRTATRDLMQLVTLSVFDKLGSAGENVKYVAVAP
jgi:ATP-dependent DNA helicase RecG